jgi:hypothetical protein
MQMLQIASVEKPIDDPALLRAVMPVVNRVWAMGVPLPGNGRPLALSLSALKRIVENARRLGLGGNLELRMTPELVQRHPLEAVRMLSELSRVLEESPAPSIEWRPMRALFGEQELAALLGTSRQSVGRYAKGARATPDDIADRLHWLAMVVSDLAGGYNDFGIRRWFHRPRAALGGRSPRQALGRNWSSISESARKVRALAAALGDIGAT